MFDDVDSGSIYQNTANVVQKIRILWAVAHFSYDFSLLLSIKTKNFFTCLPCYHKYSLFIPIINNVVRRGRFIQKASQFLYRQRKYIRDKWAFKISIFDNIVYERPLLYLVLLVLSTFLSGLYGQKRKKISKKYIL